MNTKTHDSAAEDYLADLDFIRGYEDYDRGTWEALYERWNPRRQWFYEAGRLFAAMGGEITARSAPSVLMWGVLDGSIPMQYRKEELEEMRRRTT